MQSSVTEEYEIYNRRTTNKRRIFFLTPSPYRVLPLTEEGEFLLLFMRQKVRIEIKVYKLAAIE